MTSRCHSVSERLSSAAISPSRLSNRRKTVPLPTPASAATESMVTRVDAVLLDQPRGRGEQRLAVARGVAALPRRLVEQRQLQRGRARAHPSCEPGVSLSIGNRNGPWSV